MEDEIQNYKYLFVCLHCFFLFQPLFSYSAGVREDSLLSCAHQYKIYAS